MDESSFIQMPWMQIHAGKENENNACCVIAKV